MTRLSKSVKVKKRRLCDVSSAVLQLQYPPKQVLNSTLSSMQNVTVQFQKYPPIQGHPSSVPFSCCQITTPREYRLERQETPRDPVPAETVSCSWTRDPTSTVWHSVPEVELRPRALPCNAAFPSYH